MAKGENTAHHPGRKVDRAVFHRPGGTSEYYEGGQRLYANSPAMEADAVARFTDDRSRQYMPPIKGDTTDYEPAYDPGEDYDPYAEDD
jgi:hypothetical protein